MTEKGKGKAKEWRRSAISCPFFKVSLPRDIVCYSDENRETSYGLGSPDFTGFIKNEFKIRKGKVIRKCAAYVDGYKKSQEEYWARELVWAYKKMKADGLLICFKGFRTLLNVRRDYIVQALPYIEDKEITDILNKLGKTIEQLFGGVNCGRMIR